jgi:hypothetical protein
LEREKSSELKERMTELIPWAPWPFHHAHFKQPVVHFIWLYDYVDRKGIGFDAFVDDANLCRQFEQLADFAAEFPAEAWSRLKGDTRDMAISDFRPLSEIRRGLHQEQPVAWNEVKQWFRTQIAEVGELIEEVCDEQGVIVFSCGQSDPEDCADVLEGDPWGRLFACMVKRANDYLFTTGEDHEVEVRCASRHIWDGGLRCSRPLDGRVINGFLDEQLGRAQHRFETSNGQQIKVDATRPRDFAEEASAFLVLADRAANTSREAVCNGGELVEVARYAAKRCPSASSLRAIGGSVVPGLNAVGDAEDWVERARRHNIQAGRVLQPLHGREWWRDQAFQMGEVFENHVLDWRGE